MAQLREGERAGCGAQLQAELESYLELQGCLDGLEGVLRQAFGLRLVRAAAEEGELWSATVRKLLLDPTVEFGEWGEKSASGSRSSNQRMQDVEAVARQRRRRVTGTCLARACAWASKRSRFGLGLGLGFGLGLGLGLGLG